MADAVIPQFDDGAAYERLMGRWSRLAGEIFLDWMELSSGLRWLDVGCGNGAFTELIVERSAPVAVHAIDPSEGQLAFARQRTNANAIEYRQGSAEALPFDDHTFDVATMALAINFVPEPSVGVSEMARVVKSGGCVAAYIWDLPGGGFTMEPLRQALSEMGVQTPLPRAEVTQMESLRNLWQEAGLDDVSLRRIDVNPTYVNFDDFWDVHTTNAGTNSVSKAVASLSPAQIKQLKERLRAKMPGEPDGRISYSAHANGVKGKVR